MDVNGDTLDEDNETFNVDLSNPPTRRSTTATGVGTITDDDPPPAVSIGDATVTEGNTGTVTATFTVTLDAPSGRTVTVDYAPPTARPLRRATTSPRAARSRSSRARRRSRSP